MPAPKDPEKRVQWVEKIRIATKKRFEDPVERDKMAAANKDNPKVIAARAGKSSWNKGLTKETDPRVARNGNAVSAALTGNPKLITAMTGRTLSSKHRVNIGIAKKGKPCPWMAGENSPAKRPKVRANMSAAKKGKSNPKNSVALKKYYTKNPGVRARENNGNWGGGVGDLPYDEFWTEAFRESIRARDKVCQLCGKTEAQEIDEFGQILSVHHCQYGKITKDDVFITLCKRCNSKVNRRSEREFWTGFFNLKLMLRQSNGMFNAFGMPVSITKL